MFRSDFFKIYFLPGITFQSLVIAGGYCTGQEIVQYFLVHGPAHGFLGLVTTTVIWSVVCAITYLFAKIHQTYDYKSFFQALLGKGWFLFEICYLYVILIALSVIAASVGSILHEQMGLPYTMGLLFPFLYIGKMVFKGSKAIELLFSYLSVVLYAVFFTFLLFCYQRSSSSFIPEAFSFPESFTWLKNGITYASYNLCCIHAVLFTLKYFKTRKQAIISGILSGPIASIPGIMLFFALLTEYPKIVNTIVPSSYMLEKLALPLLTFIYTLVLISTLVETGVGLVHAFNERIITEKNKKPFIFVMLILAFCLSQCGLVNLIVKGYGILTWLILGIFIFPLLSIGLVKIYQKRV